MKKIIIPGGALALILIVSQPVLASDGPAGGAPAPQAAPAATSGSDIGTWILLALIAIGAVSIIALSLRKQAAKQDKQREERSSAYSWELARVSSTLLAALIALMTFLLVVGIQNSAKGFTTELYAAIVLLGLGLIFYAVGNVIRETAINGGIKAIKSLSIMRGLQQLVFVGSIVAVVWFVISFAQLIVNPPAAPQPAAGQQQPSGQEQDAPAQPPAEPQPQETQP